MCVFSETPSTSLPYIFHVVAFFFSFFHVETSAFSFFQMGVFFLFLFRAGISHVHDGFFLLFVFFTPLLFSFPFFTMARALFPFFN